VFWRCRFLTATSSTSHQSRFFGCVFVAVGCGQARPCPSETCGDFVCRSLVCKQRPSSVRHGWSPFLIGQCARMAQAAFLRLAAWRPVLVPSRPLRGLASGVYAWGGLIALCLLSWPLVRYFGLAQVVALYGLRFDLPGAAGVLGMAYLAMRRGCLHQLTWPHSCLTGEAVIHDWLGYGLLLLATTGHQIVATNQTLFSLCGPVRPGPGRCASRRSSQGSRGLPPD